MIELHPFTANTRENVVHLRIMETTDLHVHVFPYDYYTDKPTHTAGLARTATHISQARAEARNSLLVDNGDFLQGNPMGDFLAFEQGFREGDQHPVIAVMNMLGYDASTLGNHEFNYGIGFLLKSLAMAEFPVCSANVIKHMGRTPREDRTLLKPYVLLDRKVSDGTGRTHPLRIGLIGFVPPQVMIWDRDHLAGNVSARDIVPTAQAYIPEMKERGADIIIALNHSGIGGHRAVEGMEDTSVPLAAQEGIDAILTGHSHLVFPSPHFAGYTGVDADAGTISGKPAVMAGFWGSHLGLIDLLLEREGGTWRVTASQSSTRPIFERDAQGTARPCVESDPDVLLQGRDDHARTLGYIHRETGSASSPIHSFFCHLASDRSLQVVAQAQAWRARKRLAETPYADLPLLSAAAPFKAGGRSGPDHYTNVLPGPLTLRNIADLYLFPNNLCALKVTGAQLRGWLERSASIFNTIQPGEKDALLLDPNFPVYAFEVIHGVTYEIDISRRPRFDVFGHPVHPESSRIVSLKWNGAPVRDEQDFIIATNSYRANGGGRFPGADGSTSVLSSEEANRDVLKDYVRAHPDLELDSVPTWHFTALEDTTALYYTSPQARDHLEDLARYDPEDLGDTKRGFARLRLKLG